MQGGHPPQLVQPMQTNSDGGDGVGGGDGVRYVHT